ncbi:hypothetical protein QUA70_19815 [Microcoleus sp. LAD1_D5]|uniref:hypothetical protein n=1 Tax=Microcoleus sp. LAD1_D5 TaxID=2818813 RepID=UPI002FD04A04
MIQHKNFPRLSSDALSRAAAQVDAILKLELNLIDIDCEIFTLSLDLESVQVVAERSIAFDANYKNDAQRKNALQSKLNQSGNLAKRKALQQLKARKAQSEAHLGAAKRIYQLSLLQAQGGADNG